MKDKNKFNKESKIQENDLLTLQKKYIELETQRQQNIEKFTAILAIGVIGTLIYQFFNLIINCKNYSVIQTQILLIITFIIYILIIVSIGLIIQTIPLIKKRKIQNVIKKHKISLLIISIIITLAFILLITLIQSN